MIKQSQSARVERMKQVLEESARKVSLACFSEKKQCRTQCPQDGTTTNMFPHCEPIPVFSSIEKCYVNTFSQ
jgi:hypothetical protein